MQSSDEITEKSLKNSDGSNVCEDFVGLVQAWLIKLEVYNETMLSFNIFLSYISLTFAFIFFLSFP